MSLFHTLSWLGGFLSCFLQFPCASAQHSNAQLTTSRRSAPLATPGWLVTRIAPWMGTATLAKPTSFWWSFERPGWGWEAGSRSTEFGTFSCCQEQFKAEKMPLSVWVWECLEDVRSEIHPPYHVAIFSLHLKTCEGFIRIPHSHKYIHIPPCDPSWLYQNKGEVRSYIVPTGEMHEHHMQRFDS